MENDSAKLIRSGLKGMMVDLRGLLLGVPLMILVLVVILICVFVVVASFAGIAEFHPLQIFWANTVVAVVVTAMLYTAAIQLHRSLPDVLMKRGKAYERAKKVALARKRLASRGAYTDPRHNI
ncbi:hypothetical protein SAMN05216603_103238 [Pseudomonas benzenivorans]|nr:hypothetical protein [Pseudomonas benzenivorans]SDG73601.1 hypothetical protein SAMN05216603_103238 [Pseudomonas benzenivorans]